MKIKGVAYQILTPLPQTNLNHIYDEKRKLVCWGGCQQETIQGYSLIRSRVNIKKGVKDFNHNQGLFNRLESINLYGPLAVERIRIIECNKFTLLDRIHLFRKADPKSLPVHPTVRSAPSVAPQEDAFHELQRTPAMRPSASPQGLHLYPAGNRAHQFVGKFLTPK